jgi:hypothetical protein
MAGSAQGVREPPDVIQAVRGEVTVVDEKDVHGRGLQDYGQRDYKTTDDTRRFSVSG